MRRCSTSRTASPKKATYLYYDEEPRFVRAGWHVVVAKAVSPDLSIQIALEQQQMVDAVGSRPALDPEGVLAASGSNGWRPRHPPGRALEGSRPRRASG